MKTEKLGQQAITLDLDPAYALLPPLDTKLCTDVWRDKYQHDNESYGDMAERVAHAVYLKDTEGATIPGGYYPNKEAARQAIAKCLWMPAGRILAGAGTPKRVTLLNCFVNATIEDNMESITQGLSNIMLTMQQGGGIGTDFSPIRPEKAKLFRTGASASGPEPFIDVWDAACTTIRSSGDRRGAMMGTLICTHPYLPKFIGAKHTKGKWTNFNVSVLITDAFMGAVAEDEDWYLHHAAQPNFERSPEIEALDFRDNEEVHQYVYSVWKARDLWDLIMRSTYEFAEPGVIFIDRVNDWNNLGYCEEIMCTNPCGEQPLPPHGCCDLGAVQLSRMVKAPFTDDAEFDWELLKQVTAIGTRFLDNVIDVTNYPLEEQRVEEFNKRRIGVGIAGLCDAMHMLGMRYGSPKSIRFAEDVMREVCFATYRTSIELAKEKGSFPLFNAEELLKRPFIQQLPQDIQDGIAAGFLRNGVGNTIAPTGTTSLAYSNPSSGLEPVFSHSMFRKVRQADGSWLEYEEVAYGARLFLALNPGKSLADLPSYMNVCSDVKPFEHIRIQEVCQKWTDASISKTINLPTEIGYEDFKDIYQLAYDSGCKGCTTYRPSDVRGSILSTSSEVAGKDAPGLVADLAPTFPTARPEVLTAQVCKIAWPGLSSALYLTIGFNDGHPYEVFLNSKDQSSLEWTMALTILMSMSLRQGIPLETLAKEFSQVQSLKGEWAPNGDGKQKYWPSLIAYLGYKMSGMLNTQTYVTNFIGNTVPGTNIPHSSPRPEADYPHWSPEVAVQIQMPMRQCPSCHQYAVTSLGGCLTCTECGDSKCA